MSKKSDLTMPLLFLAGGAALLFLLPKKATGSVSSSVETPTTRTAPLKSGGLYRLQGQIVPKVVDADKLGMETLIRDRFGGHRAVIQQFAIPRDASHVFVDVRQPTELNLPLDSKRWNWTRPNGRKYELEFSSVTTGLS